MLNQDKQEWEWAGLLPRSELSGGLFLPGAPGCTLVKHGVLLQSQRGCTCPREQKGWRERWPLMGGQEAGDWNLSSSGTARMGLSSTAGLLGPWDSPGEGTHGAGEDRGLVMSCPAQPGPCPLVPLPAISADLCLLGSLWLQVESGSRVKDDSSFRKGLWQLVTDYQGAHLLPLSAGHSRPRDANIVSLNEDYKLRKVRFP